MNTVYHAADLAPFPAPVPVLTRQELRYLIGVLDREIGYCGLTGEPGRYAASMQIKIRALHALRDGHLEE